MPRGAGVGPSSGEGDIDIAQPASPSWVFAGLHFPNANTSSKIEEEVEKLRKKHQKKQVAAAQYVYHFSDSRKHSNQTQRSHLVLVYTHSRD